MANHPWVRVTFFEAWAFCRWLGERLGKTIASPTEQQWERAARHLDGRAYPWGDEPDPAMMSFVETGISGSCAVGMFPAGAGVEGVLDLAGNVWEWTASPWAENADDASAEKAEDLAAAPAARRVVRGGSFRDSARRARSAYRFHGLPEYRWYDLGFRVALPRPPARSLSVDL